MIEFKEGDQVFIRWRGGNSGTYKLHKDKYEHYYVYMNTSGGKEVNRTAGEVFVDTVSVELLESATTKEDKYLLAYRSFVNDIDDYFEYRNESIKDREKVHQLLGNLTDKLKELL